MRRFLQVKLPGLSAPIRFREAFPGRPERWFPLCILPLLPSTLSAIMKKLIALLALSSLATAATLAAAADPVGNPKAANVAMCIGCHGIPGYKASFPEVYQVPMLGGQSEKYIENALKAYRKGERKHPSMRGIAGSLNDQDIANLAAYYSQQK